LGWGGYLVYAGWVLFLIPWGGCVESEPRGEKRDLVADFYQEENDRKTAIRDACQDIIAQHVETLSIKRNQMVTVDDYGVEDDAKWLKEKEYFLTKVAALQIEQNLTGSDLFGTLGSIDSLSRNIESFFESGYKQRAVDEMIENAVATYRDQQGAPAVPYDDSMSGLEYEQFCAQILQRWGWDARVTQASGDQGVDVLAEKDGLSVVLQCKKYSSPVGNKAVQEVYAGMGLHHAEAAAVVTNSSFTRAAREAAQGVPARILLLHHDELPRLYERLSAYDYR
jgi:hypothetical protein